MIIFQLFLLLTEVKEISSTYKLIVETYNFTIPLATIKQYNLTSLCYHRNRHESEVLIKMLHDNLVPIILTKWETHFKYDKLNCHQYFTIIHLKTLDQLEHFSSNISLTQSYNVIMVLVYTIGKSINRIHRQICSWRNVYVYSFSTSQLTYCCCSCEEYGKLQIIDNYSNISLQIDNKKCFNVNGLVLRIGAINYNPNIYFR